MASNNYKNRKRRKSPAGIIITLIILIVGGIFALFQGNLFGDKSGIGDPELVPEDGQVIFHFIDVDQGDAILITTPDGNILVDTSEKGAKDKLISYLDKAGVKELEYLVLTHTDADHIGNATYIIENYKIKNVMLPDFVATSKTYEKMMTAIENSDAKLICGEAGYTFKLGALQNTVIAPNRDYGDPNEMSIVFKSVYGETSVMLTGDAEVKSEEDIVKLWKLEDLKCNILKVGHHGSTTSTTDAFLSAVDPEIAVISCGEGNSYGHPHAEIIEKLKAEEIEIHRTDLEGDIVYKTDGKTFTLIKTND